MRRRHRRLIVSGLAVLALGGIAAALYFFVWHERREEHRGRTLVLQKPEAPPDLEKLRTAFNAGLDALNHKNAADAVRQLSSFTFKKRDVEEYRLWFLGQAQQMNGEHPSARATLAQLWGRDPRGLERDDAGAAL